MLWYLIPTLMLLPQWVMAFAKVSGRIKWRNLNLNFLLIVRLIHVVSPASFCVLGSLLVTLGVRVFEGESGSCSVISNSLPPHGLYSSWDSPGQNTALDSHSLFQGLFPTQELNPGLPHWRQILYQLSHQGSPLGGNGRKSKTLFLRREKFGSRVLG